MANGNDGKLDRNGLLVGRKFVEFFLPSVMMAASISLSLIVDSIIVSNILGDDALAAVNLILPITLCYTAVSGMFGIGSASCISMLKGRMDGRGADKCLTLSCIAWALVSLIGVLLGLFCTWQVSAFLSGDSGLTELVADYLRVYLLGSPFTFVTLIFPYIIKADGQPRLSSTALVIANVTNLCLDVVYMRGFGMGIEGAALATITGNAVGTALYLIYVFSKGRTLHFVKLLRADLRLYGDMFRMSVSSIFGQALMFAKMWIFNMIVTAEAGQAGLAAFSICSFCLSFVSMFIAGGAQTMMPMVSAFNGAKDYNAIRLTVKKSLRLILCCCIGVTLLFELFPDAIMAIYGVDGEDTAAIGRVAVRLFSLAFTGIGFSFMYMYYAQSSGRSAFAMQICALEGFCIIVPVCFVLSKVWGSNGIWITYSVNEILTALFIVLRARYTVRRSEGKLCGLFMLRRPEPPELELSVDVDDTAQLRLAAETAAQHVRENYPGAGDVTQLCLAALELSRSAYSELPGRAKAAMADVIVRDGMLFIKDMGRDYALLRDKGPFERLRELCGGVESTQMIGMNYTGIAFCKEACK